MDLLYRCISFSLVSIGIFQVLQEGVDSPPVVFNVTISNALGSLYHARNVIVMDRTQGMDLYQSDISTKGALASSPIKNIFVITFTLPSLKGKYDLNKFVFVVNAEVSTDNSDGVMVI